MLLYFTPVGGVAAMKSQSKEESLPKNSIAQSSPMLSPNFPFLDLALPLQSLPLCPSSRHHRRCSRHLTRSHQLPTFCSERQNAQQTSSQSCASNRTCVTAGASMRTWLIYTPVCVIPHLRPALELTLFNPSA